MFENLIIQIKVEMLMLGYLGIGSLTLIFHDKSSELSSSKT